MPEKPSGLWPAPDVVRIALFLLMVVTISRVHMHLGLEALRPALILAAVAGLFALLNPRRLAPGNLRTLPAFAIAAMGVFAFASIPFGLSIGASASYLLDNFSKVLIFAFLVIVTIRNGRDLFLFTLGYAIAIAILVWMSIWVFDVSAVASGQVERLGGLYTYDANDIGLVMVTGVPLCLLLFDRFGALGKTTLALVLVGIGWAIALTGSRGTFVALAVVAIALLLTHRGLPFIYRLGTLGVVVGAMAIAAPEGYWSQMGTVLTLEEDYNWEADEGRLALARRGVAYTLEHPVTGVGLANFGRAEGTISPVARNAMPGVGVRWNAPHNSYIQAAAELGLPGGIAFLVLVFGGMAATLRVRKTMPGQWKRGTPEERFLYAAPYYLFLSYLGFSVGALFLSFAYLDPIYVLSAFAAGLVAVTRRRLREEAAPSEAMEPFASHRTTPGMRGGLTLVEREG